MIEWTGPRERQLTSLWNEGFPTAEIGKMMGVSKSTICGKARRLDLPRRYVPPPVRPAHLKVLADLGPRDCRYPVGEVGEPDFGFCGKPTKAGSSYCQKHHARTHKRMRAA